MFCARKSSQLPASWSKKMPPPDVLLIKITLSDEKARLISYFWQNFSLDNDPFMYILTLKNAIMKNKN